MAPPLILSRLRVVQEQPENNVRMVGISWRPLSGHRGQRNAQGLDEAGTPLQFEQEREDAVVRRLVMNHAGLGQTRKGPQTTPFSGLSNKNVLCTTPTPLWISAGAWPGQAPQVVEPHR